MADPEVSAALDALYALVPDVGCKGLCASFCEPVAMSPAEAGRLAEATGVLLPVVPHDTTGRCPVLTGGRCGGYAVRPMVCRVWGAAEAMACPYGCRPDGGLLDDRQVLHLMLDSFEVGGGPFPSEQLAGMRRLADRPDLLPLIAAILRGGSPGARPE